MRRTTDLRSALACSAAVVAAFFLVNPFVNMPFDDDWCYAFTVRQLLLTGHLRYSGWSAPLLITHALWGAFFCKIFGYSFITLRFSTLPFAAGCAFFTYLLGRAALLRPAAAICATLAICLSPIFLPLALSFMTDVPALFFTLASLYCLTRAAESARRSAIVWLAAGAAVGIIGGMARQTVWIAPLCLLPYLLIIRRQNLPFLIAGVLAWFLLLLDMSLCLRWFASQPNVYLDPPLTECLRMAVHHPTIWYTNTFMVALTTVMFILPAALPFTLAAVKQLWAQRNHTRTALTAAVICALALLLSFHPEFGMMPWLYNIVTAKGVIGPLELSGNRPFTLPLPARGIVSALVLAATFILVARAVSFLADLRSLRLKVCSFFAAPTALSILAVFTAFYAGAMIIRSGQDLVFDRYCLPLMPLLAFLLLQNKSLTLAWPVLALFILYAICSTQDNLALAAARRTAIDRLESHGVPSTQIAAGFEFDFYTQLEQQLRINRYGMTNPTQPFNNYQGYTPALSARYRLEYPHLPGMRPSPFGSVHYISWLPPFHREIFIDEFKNPWWLNPHLPPGKIKPMNFEVDFESNYAN